jgi:hypothetical protein
VDLRRRIDHVDLRISDFPSTHKNYLSFREWEVKVQALVLGRPYPTHREDSQHGTSTKAVGSSGKSTIVIDVNQ